MTELGVKVHLRDSETFDDVETVSAPFPVEPDDVVASLVDVYRIEALIVPPSPGDEYVAALAYRLNV